MDIVIRHATRADRDTLVTLLHAQLEEHEIALPLDRLRAAVEGPLDDPARGVFFIAEDGEPIGVAYLSFVWALEHGGKSVWLEELYVTPARRGSGIGRRLLSTVCDYARASGCAAVDLEVEASHARAARLYERAGFEPHQRARWVLRLLRG
jgi:GNAT superfamily N-acetyltransferase